MSEPVSKFCFDSQLTKDALCLEAPPAALLPETQRRTLNELDPNHDGFLQVSFKRGNKLPASTEIKKADATYNQLSRLLLRFQADPSNNRDIDAALHHDRSKYIEELQGKLFNELSLPLLSTTIETWNHEIFEMAKRPLELTGDYKHLLALSRIIHSKAKEQSDSETRMMYLLACEDYLYTALRLAAEIPSARDKDLKNIDKELGSIKQKLQSLYDSKKEHLTKSPYIIAGIGTPLTISVESLQSNQNLEIPIAIPEDFFKEMGINLNDDGRLSKNGKSLSEEELNEVYARVLDYYNKHSLELKAAKFKDTISTRTYKLTAVTAKLDQPGLSDNNYGGDYSFHLNHRKINRTIFDETPDNKRIYFNVGFKPQDLADELKQDKTRNIWKFDLLSKRDTKVIREIPGAVVVQTKVDTSIDWYSGDPHVHHEDWRTVRNMASGLLKKRGKGSAEELSDRDKLVLDMIDRHYESVNRKFQQYLELGEEAFRNGSKQRDFMLGDLVDYVNVARTLTQQGYYLTNVRLFSWMLENYEGISYVIYGNHCFHGRKYPKTQSMRHFFDFTKRNQEAVLKLADKIAFPETGGNQLDGIQALWTRAVDHHQEHNGEVSFTLLVKRLFDELTADDIFELDNDDFQHPQMQVIGPYDFYTVSLGNGFRVGMIDTGPEDFQFFLAGRKVFPRPVRDSVIRGFDLYVNQQHVQGKGPEPQLMIALKNEIKKAYDNKEWFILGGHYPPFFKGRGADGLQDNADALRFPAALTIRLLMWFYRREQKSTLRLYMGGHVHEYSETTFDIHLTKNEEPLFRAELAEIFKENDGNRFMERIWELSQEWDLKNRMKIDRVHGAGSDGFPGHLVRELNNGKLKSPLTVTNFALSGDIPGYIEVKTSNHDSGNIQMNPFVFRETSDGRLEVKSARDISAFREERWLESNSWDPVMQKVLKPLKLPETPTELSGDKPKNSDLSRWDGFPFFYEDQNHFGLMSIDGLAEGGLLLGGHKRQYKGLTGDLRLGVQLQFPLDSRLNGGPYSWYLYGSDVMEFEKEDGLISNRLEVGAGVNTGHISFAPLVQIDTDSWLPGFGARMVISPWTYRLPIIPNFCIGAGSDINGNWWTSLALCSATTYGTYQLRDPLHPVKDLKD